MPHFIEEQTEAQKEVLFPKSFNLPDSKGLYYAEHRLERLHAKDEARATPWKPYHVAKVSIPRARECVIIVMIKFLCTSQIRCVNIIKNISLCSADLQQLSPSILVFRKDNKLALISFSIH